MTKSDIQSILGAKTVSFNSLYAKATGSVTAAVFLSQAVFWQEKAKFKGSIETIEIEGEKYFSKTAVEWYDETGLSTEQQKTARKPLVLSGILKEKRAGLPAKMYFRIDIEALVSGISAYLNEGVTVSGFSANRKPENPRTLNGKFRKQETGKSAGNIIEESLKESNESLKERGAENPLAPPYKKVDEILVESFDPETPGCVIVEMITVEAEKKETTSPGRGEKTAKKQSKTQAEIEAAKSIIQYLNEKAGRSFRVNTNENAKGIIGQLRQGYTVEQMQKVIDYKIQQWGKDAKMAEHLNPITLFRPANFERYVVATELLPIPQGPTHNNQTGNNRSRITNAGGDMSEYLKPQKF